ncbi:conserved hypothetical protein [Neospora caninum Liverpool]|uniref:Transmembrane protein n=1 Tax=Neospora caninum (strain Liverpool) TaxID=572307 RepID=F0VDF0_NEOCL|nr:conserved hypothetical protein [Neospora caninum Liverpool]CBZ51665.1 conserved hypothetical protein [Neospora caninum Liverpool]CEL65619.1 TPA: hypothetical protein BN1204_014590 [Neospora caninum Liverpool]|eukprot:XP_003881698.1 conserved hypothetical protein [Neospora caninum Liverpool]
MAETSVPSSGLTAEQTPISVPANPSTDDTGVSHEARDGAAAFGNPAHTMDSAALNEPGDTSIPSCRWTLRGVLLKVIFCVCLATLFGVIFSGIIFIFDLPQKGSGDGRRAHSHFSLPTAAPQRPDSLAFLQPVYSGDEALPTVTIFLTPNSLDAVESKTEKPADTLGKPSDSDWLVPQAVDAQSFSAPAVPRTPEV